jgi:hypothetical protein
MIQCDNDLVEESNGKITKSLQYQNEKIILIKLECQRFTKLAFHVHCMFPVYQHFSVIGDI